MPDVIVFAHPAATRLKAKTARDSGLSLRKAGAAAGVAHTVVHWWERNGGFDHLEGTAAEPDADASERNDPDAQPQSDQGKGAQPELPAGAAVGTGQPVAGDALPGVAPPISPEGWQPADVPALKAFHRYVNGLLSGATPANSLRAAQVIDTTFALTDEQHAVLLEQLTHELDLAEVMQPTGAPQTEEEAAEGDQVLVDDAMPGIPPEPQTWLPDSHVGLRAFFRYVNGLLAAATPANALRAAQAIDPRFTLSDAQHTTVLESLTSLQMGERLFFGDVAGHDFHGNQWVDGSGGGIPYDITSTAAAAAAPLTGTAHDHISAAIDLHHHLSRATEPAIRTMLSRSIQSHLSAANRLSRGPGILRQGKAAVSMAHALYGRPGRGPDARLNLLTYARAALEGRTPPPEAISAAELVRLTEAALDFGDVAGHDFHGNQWTGGLGGGGGMGTAGTAHVDSAAATATAAGRITTDDPHAAALAVARGLQVSVPAVQLAPTINTLAEMSRAAAGAGAATSVYNLSLLHAPGAEFLQGDPRLRITMPQLSTHTPVVGSVADTMARDDRNKVDIAPGLGAYVRAHGYTTTAETVDAQSLHSSQAELDAAKVAKIMNNPGFRENAAPVYISADGHVIDGHHFVAGEIAHAVATGVPVDLHVLRVNGSTEDVLNMARAYATQMGVPSQALGFEELAFGDIGGHDFHGNQWTGGIGGAQGMDRAIGSGRVITSPEAIASARLGQLLGRGRATFAYCDAQRAAGVSMADISRNVDGSSLWWRAANGYVQKPGLRTGASYSRQEAYHVAAIQGDPKAEAKLLGPILAQERTLGTPDPAVAAQVQSGLDALRADPAMTPVIDRFGLPAVYVNAGATKSNLVNGGAETPGAQYESGNGAIRAFDNSAPNLIGNGDQWAVPPPPRTTGAPTVGGGALGTLTHEYGHYVQDRLDRADPSTLVDFRTTWDAYTAGLNAKINSGGGGYTGPSGDYAVRRAAMDSAISYYSWTANWKEGFAEAFSAAMDPSLNLSNVNDLGKQLIAQARTAALVGPL